MKGKNRMAPVMEPEEEQKDNGQAEVVERIEVPRPNIQTVRFEIIGTSPLVVLRFGKKAQEGLGQEQAEPPAPGARRIRKPKDFQGDFMEALYVDDEQGWHGFNAIGLRHAMIDVCRLTRHKMVHAKISIFIPAQGWDTRIGMTPLIRIYGDKPEMYVSPVVNANQRVDLRARAMWRKWSAKPDIQFDADMFKREHIANLLFRAGIQNGLCEGRYNSKNGPGMGFGAFKVEGME